MSYVPNYRKVNHSFHLLMSAVTLGVWAMTVWPCAILFTWWTNRGKRKRSDVQFSESLRLPAPPPREEFVHGVPYPVRHVSLPVIPALPQRSTVTPHARVDRVRPYAKGPGTYQGARRVDDAAYPGAFGYGAPFGAPVQSDHGSGGSCAPTGRGADPVPRATTPAAPTSSVTPTQPPAVTPQPPTPTSAPAPVQPVITPRVVTPVRPVAHVKVRHTKTREDCP